MPPESPLVTHGRWLRAAVFSLAMTVLAITAHLLAGGDLPGYGLTVLAGLLVGCLTYPITRRDRGARAIVATTVAAQAALHLAFAVPMAGLARASAAGGTGTVGHMVMPTGASGVSVEQAWTALSLDSPTPAMLAAHAVAAVVLALGLRRGEQALLDLAAALRAFFDLLVAIVTGRLEPVAAGSVSPSHGAFDVVESAGTMLGHSRWGRAPPVAGTR
ncbi:MAG TPA: hypothetical protein VIM10_07575 [Actinopolymorphaceae bacterium]|jgi:hypothetical protein